MKYYLLIVASLLISSSSFAEQGNASDRASAIANASSASAALGPIVNQLKPYVYAIRKEKVKGTSAEAMLKDYALRINGVDPSEFELKNYESVPGADETSGVYGLTRMD